MFEDGEAFVPVQTQTVSLHPWTIENSGEPVSFREGTPAVAEGGEISLGSTRILLSAARIEALSLPRISAEAAVIAQRNFPLVAQFVKEMQKTRSPDPFQPQIDAILERWHKSNDPGTLFDLIGLGASSTPSGDDVLVGIIAGMSLFEHTDDQTKEALTRLRADIEETARSLTPLPSAQMLLSACERSFGEPILGLLGALASSSASDGELLEGIEHVAQLGHHSGSTILLGLTRYCIESQLSLLIGTVTAFVDCIGNEKQLPWPVEQVSLLHRPSCGNPCHLLRFTPLLQPAIGLLHHGIEPRR